MSSRTKETVWTERALVALILSSLAGALFLTISVYRRALKTPKAEPVQPPALVATAEPEPDPEPDPAPAVAAAEPEPAPEPEPTPPQPQEDPTEKALAELSAATQREIDETNRLDKRLRELESARLAAVAQSDNWRQREMLVKRQIAEMSRRAETLDRQADQLAAQRDVLASLRDSLKAAHARAEGRGSYAVLPYKGENGTWRRPIVLECADGTVTLRPNGPTFSMLDLSGLINPRSSPFIIAVARELVKVQASDSPDGAGVIPYFVFLVRPDGIRPYYEARARLESLGVAFGYELIDQDLKVDVPDFDDVATWDGSPGGPPPAPVNIASGAPGGTDGAGGPEPGPSASANPIRPGSPLGLGAGATNRGPITDALAGGTGGLSWPGAAGRGEGAGGGNGDSPEDFVWSGRPGGRRDGRGVSEGNLPDLEPAGGAEFEASGGRKPPVRAEASGSAPPSTAGGTEFEASGGRKPPVRAEGSGNVPSAFAPPSVGAAKFEASGGRKPPVRAEGSGSAPPTLAPSTAGLPSPGPTPAGRGPGASPEKPGATGLMWGDGPTSAAGPMAAAGTDSGTGQGAPGSASENGSNSSKATDGKPGVDSGTLADLANGGGSESGPRPRLSLSGDAEAAARKPNGYPPPPSLGAGVDPLSALAGLLGGAAGDGGKPGGGSGLMIGSDANSGQGAGASGDPSQAKDELDEALAKNRLLDEPSTKVEVPFVITIACDADGLTIQPGGYRITAKALEEGRAEKLLVRHLASAARRRALADPDIRPLPRVKFLIERDGGSTFWEARKQLLFADLNWPMTLQVAGGQSPRLFDREAWQ